MTWWIRFATASVGYRIALVTAVTTVAFVIDVAFDIRLSSNPFVVLIVAVGLAFGARVGLSAGVVASLWVTWMWYGSIPGDWTFERLFFYAIIGGAVGLSRDLGMRLIRREREILQLTNRDPLTERARLQRAVESGELFLEYQPTVAADSGAMMRVEALVRWQHPQRGRLGPIEFIPSAERAGTIRIITDWVIATALEQHVRWRAEFAIEIPVAVNVSVVDLLDPAFPDIVAALLKRIPVSSEMLGIEVTEGTLVSDVDKVAAALGRLGMLGIRTALDDFGTGYSSLSLLRQLPLNAMKLDRSFVASITKDQRSRSVVEACVRLGHSLGYLVIAEGVEDAGIEAMAALLGCDGLQGFYLGGPLSPDGVVEWMKRGSIRIERLRPTPIVMSGALPALSIPTGLN